LIGSRLLIAPKRQAETAEALDIQRESEGASLATTSYALSEGLSRCWQFHVQLMGGDSSGVEEKLNRDFTSRRLAPDEVAAQLSLVMAGKLSTETLLENLYEGEIGRDPETERERLDAEGPSAPPVNAANEFGDPNAPQNTAPVSTPPTGQSTPIQVE
jgi:hypothetical protein